MNTIITIPGPVRVTLCESIGFTDKQLEKIKQAMCVISFVVNSEEFHRRLSGMSFTSTIDSPEEIYKKISLGREDFGSVANTFGMDHSDDDHEIDLSLRYYNSWWSKVIGYGLPHSAWVWMNWKYHASFSVPQMAGNLFHEWLHKIGYDHASARDLASAPYAIGNLVSELGGIHMNESMELMGKIQIISNGERQ